MVTLGIAYKPNLQLSRAFPLTDETILVEPLSTTVPLLLESV